jgi:hypothetical protein
MYTHTQSQKLSIEAYIKPNGTAGNAGVGGYKAFKWRRMALVAPLKFCVASISNHSEVI